MARGYFGKMKQLLSLEWLLLRSTFLRKKRQQHSDTSSFVRGPLLIFGIPTPFGLYLRCVAYGDCKQLHFNIIKHLQDIANVVPDETGILIDIGMQDDDLNWLKTIDNGSFVHFSRCSARKMWEQFLHSYRSVMRECVLPEVKSHKSSNAFSVVTVSTNDANRFFFDGINVNNETLQPIIASGLNPSMKILSVSQLIQSVSTIPAASPTNKHDEFCDVDFIPNLSLMSNRIDRTKHQYSEWQRVSPKSALILGEFDQFALFLREWLSDLRNSCANHPSKTVGNVDASGTSANPSKTDTTLVSTDISNVYTQASETIADVRQWEGSNVHILQQNGSSKNSH